MDGTQETLQTSTPETPPKEKPPFIITGEVTLVPKYESSVPRQITDAILQDEQTQRDLPVLGSSIIEDFVIGQIKAGVTDPETIAVAFVKEDVAARVRLVAQTAKQASDTMDWNETFTLTDAKAAQAKVTAEMESMGMSSEQIAEVASMDVEISEGIGVSSLSQQGVYSSRLQAVRKAIDYQKVYGTGVSLEKIVRTIMMNTIGHELGHKVDDVAGGAVNNIPVDEIWKNGDDSGESKSERFAEFWGRTAIVGDHEMSAIMKRERALQVAKVAQFWNAVTAYNSTHDQKVDVMGVFRAIDGKIDKADEITTLVFSARKIFYGVHGPENYATPYSRDLVAQAVRLKAA